MRKKVKPIKEGKICGKESYLKHTLMNASRIKDERQKKVIRSGSCLN